MQLACCCGSAACSCCCKCCPKIKQSTGTRVMYALYFLLVTVVCVTMMSPTVEQKIKTHVSTRMADAKLAGPFETGQPPLDRHIRCHPSAFVSVTG